MEDGYSFPVGRTDETAEQFTKRLQGARPRKVKRTRLGWSVEMRGTSIEVWDGAVGPRARYVRGSR